MSYRFDNAEVTKSYTILNVPQNAYFYLLGHFQVEILTGCCHLNGVPLGKGIHQIQQSYYSPAFLFVFPEQTSIKFTPLKTIHVMLYSLPQSFLKQNTTVQDTLLSETVFPFGGIRIVDNSTFRRMKIPKNWRRVVKRVENTIESGPLRIAVVGPKGCGKSTFVNMLVNSLCLKTCICVFDIDCGQPYSGIIGTFSLLVFDKQDFNEYFFGKKPLHARRFVIGSNSMNNNIPLVYHTIRSMMKVYLEEFSNFPMVINTSGWVSGFGMELLQYVLQVTSCQVLIDITQYDGLTYLNDICPSKIVIKSCTSVTRGLPNLFTAPVRREIALESIFNNANCYVIDFNNLCIAFMDSICSSTILSSIHQRYLFLSHIQSCEDQIKNNNTTYPVVAQLEMESLPLTFGLGLVWVDPHKKLLYIKTSVNEVDMQKVNTLIYSLYMEAPLLPPVVEGEIGPYTAYDQKIYGSTREHFKYLRRHFD